MRWDDLNMGDKSQRIKLAVDLGITDLRTIRDVYNSYAEGGHLFETGGPEGPGVWEGDLERPLHLRVNSSTNKAFSPLNAARQPINNEESVYTLGNWLNNRRDILLKNIQDAGMEEKYDKYFTAMPLFQLQMFPSEDQRIVNNAIESQLHNVESAGYKEGLLPLFTDGRYNTKENTVELSTVLGESGINKDVVKLHEFTHALGHDSPQEAVIRKHFEGRGGKDKYYDNPSELYARLMTFRKLHNIDPNKTYTAEDIKNIRQEAAQDFEDVITKPWDEHDKLQNEYAKKLADYLYPKLWPQLKDAWWWNRNGGKSEFYNNLKNDFNYARSLANDYNIEIPEDILDIFNRSIKVIDNDNSLQGVRYHEDDDFLRRLSDEDLLFLINEVASAPSKPMDMSNIAANGGHLFKDGGFTGEEFVGPPAPYIPSDSIKNYIKSTEAFRDKWYKDGNGIDTVGYGFTGDKVKELYPNGMTREQADAYFDTLVSKFARRMQQLTPNIDKLTQNQKDALFSYFYNIGEGTYSKKSPKMQKALQDMDWDTVVQNIDAGYNDKKNPGLRKRRDYERALFEMDIPRPLQPIPPAVNREPLYNPTISRFNTAIPFKNGKKEVFNPFMFNLKP